MCAKHSRFKDALFLEVPRLRKKKMIIGTLALKPSVFRNWPL